MTYPLATPLAVCIPLALEDYYPTCWTVPAVPHKTVSVVIARPVEGVVVAHPVPTGASRDVGVQTESPEGDPEGDSASEESDGAFEESKGDSDESDSNSEGHSDSNSEESEDDDSDSEGSLVDFIVPDKRKRRCVIDE